MHIIRNDGVGGSNPSCGTVYLFVFASRAPLLRVGVVDLANICRHLVATLVQDGSGSERQQGSPQRTGTKSDSVAIHLGNVIMSQRGVVH
jgi:hypothetical protein